MAISRKAYLRPGKGVSSTKVFKGVTRIAAKRGMNWVMVYVSCLSSHVYLILKVDVLTRFS